MRDLRFRGRAVNGDWYTGLIAHTEEHGWTISNRAGRPFAYQVSPETIGQYTGLKDKNGREIYEGDILKIDGWNPHLSYTVTFDRGGFCFYWSPEDGYYSDIKYAEKSEVIGNIYENPELLNSENEKPS